MLLQADPLYEKEIHIASNDPGQEFIPDLDYLRLIAMSREADIREGILFRQGKGYLCTPSAGHENLAAIAYAINQEDHIFCHYRDRALLLARGVSLHDIALTFFAKADSSSAGRQMAGHYSAPEFNIISCASPIASQCIPASGMAWAKKIKGDNSIVVCCLGEAGLRQGEFYEAYAFAVQEKLPVLFVVEDNGYGISTPTENFNPLKLGIFSKERIVHVDGRMPEQVYYSVQRTAEMARSGFGPSILSISFDRLLSHTSSDDHRLYRDQAELDLCAARDPLKLLNNRFVSQKILNEDGLSSLEVEIRDYVKRIYFEANQASDPVPSKITEHVFAENNPCHVDISFLQSHDNLTYAGALNKSLEHLLQSKGEVCLFGQDIEDPKGGVFGLTKGLSTAFPGRVVNAPLAEATICGAAVGMALAGFLPIFEIQFIDFMATGFNQIVNQMATMRWRTAGQLKCPVILLAPCGGYVQGAGPWHTQTNEAIFAHTPGIKISMPSTPEDVAYTLVKAAQGSDPHLILLPKHLFFKNQGGVTLERYIPPNRLVATGQDVTIVAWGNCVELGIQASHALLSHGLSADVINICDIVPFQRDIIMSSIAKTGRLIVVHEDNRTCGFGQAIISEIVTDTESWGHFYTAPKLVCRDDVLVPFHPTIAQSVLPSSQKIVDAALSIMGARA